MDLKDRFVILLVYYRLYMTYTLTGSLFDLDKSTICIDIQKIEGWVRGCIPIPQKICPMTKRLKTAEEVEELFSKLSCFYGFHRKTDTNKTCWYRKKEYFSGKKKKHAIKNYLMVKNGLFIIHKTNHHKKGMRITMMYTRRINLSPKTSCKCD